MLTNWPMGGFQGLSYLLSDNYFTLRFAFCPIANLSKALMTNIRILTNIKIATASSMSEEFHSNIVLVKK